MQCAAELTRVFGGILPENISSTRPRLAAGKTPTLDCAHASYRSNAAAAARCFTGAEDHQPYSRLSMSVPLFEGRPLVYSCKAAIDGIVLAGVFPDDKCNVITHMTVQRHSPNVSPQTFAWLDQFAGQDVSFSFNGLPAPPLYLPVNTFPKFKPGKLTPESYRQSLVQAPTGPYGEFERLSAPSMHSQLIVRLWSSVPVDLDNCVLRVLDTLEVARPPEISPLLLDEIINLVDAQYMGQSETNRVEFEFWDRVERAP